MRRLTASGILALVPLLGSACKVPPPAPVSIPFADDFERNEVGDDYFLTGGVWTIRDGQLFSPGSNNAPLFLGAKLPDDVVVEVDVRSDTRLVDAKLELMTDGRRHQSGYVFVLGGWKNTVSVIARQDEHAKNRAEKKPTGVSGERWYRWRIEKKGGRLEWFVDGTPYLRYVDPNPLQGPGHDRFALNNWHNRLRFDRLRIWPHGAAPPASAHPSRRAAPAPSAPASSGSDAAKSAPKAPAKFPWKKETR